MRIPNVYKFLLLLFIPIAAIQGYAQNADKEVAALREILKEDRSAAEALALYPEQIRDSIFVASAHPELISRISLLQKQSSAAFRKLIANLSKEEKQGIWGMVRDPDLLKSGRSGKQNIPAGIVDLHKSVQSAFESILQDSPAGTQLALRKLVEMPDVFSILVDHLDMTILVGEIYKKDPEGLKKRAAELNAELVGRMREGIQNWKELLEADPASIEDLEKAVHEIARDYGYDPSIVLVSVSEKELNAPVEAFPYWYGSPDWFQNPRWYSYPYWYFSGYYYDSQRKMHLVGTPSFEFLRCYFQNDHHLEEYPHLGGNLIRYYESHRRWNHTFNATVGEWVENHRKMIPPLESKSLTEQLMSKAIPVVPPPERQEQSLEERLQLEPVSGFQYQVAATDYFMGSWDAAARERYIESRIPD